MKKSGIIVLMSIFTAAILSGCTPKVKEEADLTVELTEHKDFIDVENAEVSNMEIIKRQTDKDAKEDIVFVQVAGENEEVAFEKSYRLKYGLYDQGWMLDQVTEYSEGVNKVTPKKSAPQEKVDADVQALSDLAYQYESKTEDLANGLCSYTYVYVTEDGCASMTCQIDYEFDEDTVAWKKAKVNESLAILTAPPQTVTDADMASVSDLGFTIYDVILDTEYGGCQVMYYYKQESAVSARHMLYILNYYFDENRMKWIFRDAEMTQNQLEWGDIAGTWTATHAETSSVYKKYETPVDRHYEMIISDVQAETFKAQVYRDGELVLDLDDCHKNNYTIWANGGTTRVANLQISEESFYFGDYFTIEAVFEKVQ